MNGLLFILRGVCGVLFCVVFAVFYSAWCLRCFILRGVCGVLFCVVFAVFYLWVRSSNPKLHTHIQ